MKNIRGSNIRKQRKNVGTWNILLHSERKPQNNWYLSIQTLLYFENKRYDYKKKKLKNFLVGFDREKKKKTGKNKIALWVKNYLFIFVNVKVN